MSYSKPIMSDFIKINTLCVRIERSWLWIILLLIGFCSSACEEASPPSVVESVLSNSKVPGVQEAPPASASVSPMLRPPQAGECKNNTPHIVPNVIRRLTRFEYKRTIQMLIGADSSSMISAFPPEEEVLGFDNQSKSLQISALHVEQYMKAAEEIAELAYQRLPSISPCVPQSEQDEMCIRQFIERFGLRAWRRPLSNEEQQTLITLYQQEVVASFQDQNTLLPDLIGPIDPLKDAITLVITAILQSPYFLYRVEIGEGQGDTRSLTQYEIASRLSYLLWRSMPDDKLFAQAAAGTLSTPEGLIMEAERMLQDPQSADGLWSFFEQWLALDEVAQLDKDKGIFPSYTKNLNDLMATEARMFVEEVVFERKDMRQLLTGTFSFHNYPLAVHYARGGEGAEVPVHLIQDSLDWASNTQDLPQGDSFIEVELSPKRRSGILTRAAVLALTTKANKGDPVHRGIYVRERILCTPLPPPPPDIVVVAPDPDPSLTTREQFAEHSQNASCAGCHRLVDPIGFGLENYDPIGRWRESENQKPIDASGELFATFDIDGAFQGSQQLANTLAQSEQVQRCMVLNFYRYAQGRAEVMDEVCDVDQLYQGFQNDQYDFMSILRTMISSPAFTKKGFVMDTPTTTRRKVREYDK